MTVTSVTRVRRSLVLVLALAAACRAGPGAAKLKSAVLASASREGHSISVAFRFPGQRGKAVRIYRLPDLDEATWSFPTPRLATERVVGFDDDDDRLLLVSTKHDLVVLDLDAGVPRTADSNVTVATLDPTGTPILAHADGSLATMDGRTPTAAGTASSDDTVEGLWGMVGGRVLAAVRAAHGRALVTFSEDQAPTRRAIPVGPLAVAPWGDAVAVATDSGVSVVSPLGKTPDRFARFNAAPTALTFSASGHRLYVATADGPIVALERFDLSVVRRFAVPAVARALREDPLGRMLLVRPVKGDSFWVVPLGPRQPTALAVPGGWADDLPAVAPDGTILARRGKDVVALASGSLRVLGRVPGGGRDQWLPAAWSPRRPALQIAADTSRSAASTAGQQLYVQVSSTTNQGWADDLARDLRRAGMKSAVLPPEGAEGTYRVVIGPYATRDEAEAIGRKLGMPFWIYTRTTDSSPPQ